MAEDEPSIPMDQEEEDNDEYFSAREVQKKGSQEALKSSTPTPLTSSPNITESSPRQQLFFSDEKAQQISSAESTETKKSQKVRTLLKDRNRWDMCDYKKEELEPKPKPKKKKKKSKTPKKKPAVAAEKKEKEEKSKTDEESEEEEPSPVKESVKAPAKALPQPRPFFLVEQLGLKCKWDNPIAPKCSFDVLRFTKSQEIVEYDADGQQHVHNQYTERAISNPWRRWGSHKTLSEQGGFMVGKNKKLVEIKRGSEPPRCPPNPRQVTLNKNCEAPDSQTMMGTIRVEVRAAEDEVHRIGKVMEEYVRNGGFAPPPMTKKEMAAKPAKPTKSAKTPKKKKASSSSTESQEGGTEDDSIAEKGKPVKDDSKKANFGFLKRKKSATTPKLPKRK